MLLSLLVLFCVSCLKRLPGLSSLVYVDLANDKRTNRSSATADVTPGAGDGSKRDQTVLGRFEISFPPKISKTILLVLFFLNST